MAETIKVNPTPIQRNKFDVAMELLQLHRSISPFEAQVQPEDLEKLFAKYFALAAYLEQSNLISLENLLDEELLLELNKR